MNEEDTHSTAVDPDNEHPPAGRMPTGVRWDNTAGWPPERKHTPAGGALG